MDYIIIDKSKSKLHNIFIPDDVYLIIKSYLFKTPEKIIMDKVIFQLNTIIRKTNVYKNLNLNTKARFIWNNMLLSKKIKYLK
jgi:hypothetical protein